MLRSILMTSTVMLGLGAPAAANPTVDFGLSFAFGDTAPQIGFGFPVYSDNRQDWLAGIIGIGSMFGLAGTIGIDSMFGLQSLRPPFGAAYIARGGYVGFDMGFGINGGGIDFGATVGGVTSTAE
jgi:hypothetical protein